jgi:predicted RNA binding protein YcfA (HicA-like mRNA interferase family)
MPSLSQLPSNVSRRQFICALKKLGFEVSKKGGSGSHYKATWPKTQKSITIQCGLRKDVLCYLLKEIKQYSGIEWEDIKRVL